MRVRIVAVGKIKSRDLRACVDDYVGRIQRYARVEEREVRDGPAAEVADRLRRAIPDRSHVIALEVDGESMSSEGFSRLLAGCEGRGVQTGVFLVGGAYGLPPDVSRAADTRLSLSPMTLPHRLARLLLVEQIYRAFTILRGEPYSH